MLSSEHAIAAYRDGRIVPDRLTSKAHARYPLYADRMLAVYREGTGRTRRDFHREVREVFADEPDCPVRRIEAFCKLLDDASDFERDRSGRSATLRREVFRKAAALHPLVRQPDRLFEHEERAAKDGIARALGRPWDGIERDLFNDVMEFHRLRAFPGYPDARALLSRYNVAQVQVALYGAVRMTVWASRDFKTILRYAKLARLLHTIRRTGSDAYEIHLDGPASILRETRRYGVAMAKFLPALLACEGWRMHATVKTPRAGRLVDLNLSPKDGLTSHLPPPGEFDSSVEEGFARKWGDKPREGWTLIREGEILHHDQKVFVPDFVFRHVDGREVPMEIVGFWTPEYLAAKRETLRTFRYRRILLAVAEGIRKERDGPYEGVVFFKGAILMKDVLERLLVPYSGT